MVGVFSLGSPGSPPPPKKKGYMPIFHSILVNLEELGKFMTPAGSGGSQPIFFDSPKV